MKSNKIISVLIITVLVTLKLSTITYADTVENNKLESLNLEGSYKDDTILIEQEKQFIKPFRLAFNEDMDPITGEESIFLDGDMSDWSNINYLNDLDKYGPHGEDIIGASYYIDKSNNYLYLKVGLKSTRVKHLRIWGVKNKNTFNEFLRRYNTGGGIETGLISTLENDKAGVVSFSANIEKLTSSQPTRVQVLNHNANAFKEQGFWVDEANNMAEFRIPLSELTGPDGSHNFDLVIGTDLYNWPTADFMMISLSSGSTGPIVAGTCGLLLVIIIAIKLRTNKNN